MVPSPNPLVSFDLWSNLEEEVANYVVSALAPEKEEHVVLLMTALHMTYQSVSSVAKAERIPART